VIERRDDPVLKSELGRCQLSTVIDFDKREEGGEGRLELV